MALTPEFLRMRGLLGYEPMPGLFNAPMPQQQVPQQQAPPPMAPQQSQGRSVVADALSRAFGGASDPRLSAAQNEEAKRQAMIQAGLAILASPDNGLRAVAQGALYGQQAGAQAREGLYGRQQEVDFQNALAKIFGSDGDVLPKLYAAYAQAAQMGNTQLATSLATLIQAREATERGMGGSEVNWQVREGVNPQTGKPEQYAFDPRTQAVKWLGVAPVPSAQASTGLADQRVFARENALRDDYKAEIKDTQEAYKFIDQALAKQTDAEAGNAAAKVGMLYAFVKAMDPTSVVREGEIALVNRAAPLWSRAKGLYQNVIEGKSPAIPPDMVPQMADYMRQMQIQKETFWSEVYDNYADSAKRWGVSESAFRKPPTKYRPRRAPF